MRPVILPLLGLLALAACATEPSATGAFVNRAAVDHPEALFDVAARSDALRRNDGRTGRPRGERVCPQPRNLVDIEPLVGPSMRAMVGSTEYSRAPREFGRALNGRAYRLLVDQDMDRASQDIAAVRAHAEANAWLRGGPPKNSVASTIIDGMLPTLPAWQILRQTSAATESDRQVIDAWLQRLARYADTHPGENSAGTARGANDMLLGLMTGDAGRYRKGVSTGFYRQLGSMRADGSFPLEVDRGLTALDNTNRNIALLVYSAQIAESQGTDLYTAQVNGRGLDDAIGFLLRASDDNGLVDVYAAANRNPSKDHPVFRPNAQVDPFLTSAGRAWPVLYSARFPNTPLTEDLLGRIEPARRVANDTVGGWVSCYAGRL
jgi:Alginate lyase